MPVPKPPSYLVLKQLEHICGSLTFGKEEFSRELLTFLVIQTLRGERTTQNTLVEKFKGPPPPDARPDMKAKIAENHKSQMRGGIKKLRDLLDNAYYKSREASEDIVVISIPRAGVDPQTGTVSHYEAEFSFHERLHRSADTFATILFMKYGLPIEDGQKWYELGIEPRFLKQKFVEEGLWNTHLAGQLGTLAPTPETPWHKDIELVRWRAFQAVAEALVTAHAIKGVLRPLKRVLSARLLSAAARSYLEPYAENETIPMLRAARSGHKTMWNAYLQRGRNKQKDLFASAAQLYKAHDTDDESPIECFYARFWAACAYAECGDLSGADEFLDRAYRGGADLVNWAVGSHDSFIQLAIIVDILEAHIPEPQRVKKVYIYWPEGAQDPAFFPPGTKWYAAVTHGTDLATVVPWTARQF